MPTVGWPLLPLVFGCEIAPVRTIPFFPPTSPIHITSHLRSHGLWAHHSAHTRIGWFAPRCALGRKALGSARSCREGLVAGSGQPGRFTWAAYTPFDHQPLGESAPRSQRDPGRCRRLAAPQPFSRRRGSVRHEKYRRHTPGRTSFSCGRGTVQPLQCSVGPRTPLSLVPSPCLVLSSPLSMRAFVPSCPRLSFSDQVVDVVVKQPWLAAVGLGC